MPLDPALPFAQSVFHPTDFSEASHRAFAYALAIALVRECRLDIVHVGKRQLSAEEWQNFPAVRDTLARWGVLEAGSHRKDVYDRLSVRVKKVSTVDASPIAACVRYLKESPSDLIVLASEGREGLPAWLRPSGAEKIARTTATNTLFVPAGGRGFVDLETGSLSLKRILVPAAAEPNPGAALTYAARAAGAFGDSGGEVEIQVLHVDDGSPAARLDLPEVAGVRWSKLERDGDVVEEIAERAESADLVAMATEGRDGILDALRGSVTERIVRRATCPVLAVPFDRKD